MRPGALAIAIVMTASAVPAAADKETGTSAVRPSPREVSVAAVGDVLFGRYIRSRKRYRRVANVDQPFEHVREIVEGADIAFANVETPVMDEPKRFTVYESLTFRAEPSDAGALAEAGFDVASIANNHTMNMGYDGAPITRDNVADAGLDPCGAGATEAEATEPVVTEVDGARVMFLCYTVWTNGRNSSGKGGAVAYVRDRRTHKELPEIIKQARAEHEPDYTVVSVHWGIEYEQHPRRGQRRAARAMVDAGADLVLGHHAHVLQDFEVYDGAVIAYSLGNFLFDNPKRDQRETVILEARLSGSGEDRRVEATLHPVWIDRTKKERNRPKLATGKRYRRIKRTLKKLAPGIEVAPDPTR